MRILILMYHMISKANHPSEKKYALSPSHFRKQISYLKTNGYTPVSLDDLYEYAANSSHNLPEKPVIITFDDGYMDNYEYAFPILKQFSFSATVFIVSGLVGQTSQWEKNGVAPERPLMGWREINALKESGVTIGSHTVSHRRLSRLSPENVKFEIEDSKKFLEDRLGTSIKHFAYPYGDMAGAVVREVNNAGYKTACSASPGFNGNDMNPLALRRVAVFGTDSVLSFATKVTFATNDGGLSIPISYYAKRLSERIKL